MTDETARLAAEVLSLDAQLAEATRQLDATKARLVEVVAKRDWAQDAALLSRNGDLMRENAQLAEELKQAQEKLAYFHKTPNEKGH